MAADESAAQAVAIYLQMLDESVRERPEKRLERSGKGQIKLTNIEISSNDSIASQILATGRPAFFTFQVSEFRRGLTCSFAIYDKVGQPVTFFDSALHSEADLADLIQPRTFQCVIDELPLLPGRYRIDVNLYWSREHQDTLEAAAFFDVKQGKLRERPAGNYANYGNVLIHHHWRTSMQK
jgi:lipopolysaccharide transport system ATP-binding protein